MQRLTIAGELQRRSIAASIMAAPLGSRVTIGPALKSRAQESKWHAMLGEIAEQAQHMGAKWELDDWKRLLLKKWAKDHEEAGIGRVIPDLDGDGIVQLGIQSRHLSEALYGSLIEFTQMWCAENGVELSQ